jgi:hypothetical protein
LKGSFISASSVFALTRPRDGSPFRAVGAGAGYKNECHQAGQLRFDCRIIPQIRMPDLAKLPLLNPSDGSPDRLHLLHVGAKQAFAQHPVPTIPVAQHRITFPRHSH